MSRITSLAAALLASGSLAFSGTALAQADNTNSRTDPTFSQWMHDYSMANQGRISRDAYLREQQRRCDQMDREQRGLTMDEIDRTYGYGWNRGPAGTVTTPGYMGPNNVKQ
jgi:hypothetical protein